MANIIEYNGPQNPEIRPSEIGERSLYQEARVTHQMGEESGQRIKQGADALAGAVDKIAKQYAHTDITNTVSQFATTQNDLTDASEKMLKDPNLDLSNPHLAADFMEKTYNPAMQKIKDGVKTQQGMDAFNEHYNAFSSAFHRQLQNDLTVQSGIHADAALNDYVNKQSQAVTMNPSLLAPTLATWDSTIKNVVDTSPFMSGTEAERLKDAHGILGRQKFEHAALGSIMLKDPNQAQKLLESGAFPDVDGTQANMAIKQMQTMAKQNAAADRANQRFAEEEHNDKMMASTVSQIGTLAKAAQTGDPSALQKLKDMGTQILIDGPKNGMKGTTSFQAHEMINQTMRQITTKEDTLTDPSTLATLHTKMLDPNGPQLTPSDIVKENLEGKLSTADTHETINLLNTMKADPSTQNYMQQFKETTAGFESIIKGAQSQTTEVPGLGGYRYNEFLNDHLKSFQQGLTAGLTSQQMLDPAGKDYIFKDLNDYMTAPMQEQTVFGKQFTLSDGLAPAVPTSVRVMEAWRQQTQDAKARQDRMNKLTGTAIEDRTGGPPMPNPMPDPQLGGGL